MAPRIVRRLLVAGGLLIVAASALVIVIDVLCAVFATVDLGTAAVGFGMFGLVPMGIGVGLVWMGDHTLPARGLASGRHGACRHAPANCGPSTDCSAALTDRSSPT